MEKQKKNVLLDNQFGPQQTMWYALCSFSSSDRLGRAALPTAAWEEEEEERDAGTARRPVTTARW